MPFGVIWPILVDAANQRSPPGPTAIFVGKPGLGSGNSLIVPLGVIWPIFSPRPSVNQGRRPGQRRSRSGSCLLWESKLADLSARGYPSDHVGHRLGEPQVPIWTGRDRGSTAVDCAWDRKLADRAARGDPADVVAARLGEPEVVIGTDRDPGREAVRRGNREQLESAAWRQPTDLVGGDLGEPDVAFRADREPPG